MRIPWSHWIVGLVVPVCILVLVRVRPVESALGVDGVGTLTVLAAMLPVLLGSWHLGRSPFVLQLVVWLVMSAAALLLLRGEWLQAEVGVGGIRILSLGLVVIPSVWRLGYDGQPPRVIVGAWPEVVRLGCSAALAVLLCVLAPTQEAAERAFLGGFVGFFLVALYAPFRAHSRTLLAKTYTSAGKGDLARQFNTYRWVSSWTPEMLWGYPEVWAWGVGVLAQAEKPAAAVTLFTRGLRCCHGRSPEAPQALADARRAALSAGGVERERRLLQQVVEKSPGTPIAEQAARAAAAAPTEQAP